MNLNYKYILTNNVAWLGLSREPLVQTLFGISNSGIPVPAPIVVRRVTKPSFLRYGSCEKENCFNKPASSFTVFGALLPGRE